LILKGRTKWGKGFPVFLNFQAPQNFCSQFLIVKCQVKNLINFKNQGFSGWGYCYTFCVRTFILENLVKKKSPMRHFALENQTGNKFESITSEKFTLKGKREETKC